MKTIYQMIMESRPDPIEIDRFTVKMDWSKKWKEKWTVTHVTQNIAVVPSWLEYNPNEKEVVID